MDLQTAIEESTRFLRSIAAEGRRRAFWDGGAYRDRTTGKEILQISFSGGRTSAYMTKRLLDEYADRYTFIVTFANTSREHPKTLDFVHACDTHFGFNTVWLEAVTHHNTRKGSTHRVVTYETAKRNGEVYEDHIRKYGVPNVKYPQCTRELKLNPMNSYLADIGVDYRLVKTAIGIREDERRRVAKSADTQNIVYPLVDWFPTDKGEVLDWWEQQAFDLEIEEFEGNCLACFKKSRRKLFAQIERDPNAFNFTREMEDKYRNVRVTAGPEATRVFFRDNMDTRGLFRLYETVGRNAAHRAGAPDEDGGCSESCEVFETQIAEGLFSS